MFFTQAMKAEQLSKILGAGTARCTDPLPDGEERVGRGISTAARETCPWLRQLSPAWQQLLDVPEPGKTRKMQRSSSERKGKGKSD